jgi:tripartite motif-containing protein 71
MPARTLAFKVLSVLVIFVFLFGNTAVAFAQQPDPVTPTPAAAEPTATLEVTEETPAALTGAPTAAPTGTPTEAPTQTPVQAPAEALTQAPASFTISGKVTGKDGQPLAGVAVADDHGDRVTTGDDGAYALPGLQPGTYLVAPKLEGQVFLPYYQVVRLADKDASGVDFYLPKVDPKAAIAPTHQPAGSPTYQPHPPSGQASQPANPSEDGISSQAVYTPGAPGLVYRYDSQKGQAGAAYLLDTPGSITHLNGPVGVAVDHSGNLLVAEEKGSRVVRFNSTGVSNLTLGTAGLRYTDDYVFGRLLGAAEQPTAHTIWVADNSRLVEYNPTTGEKILSLPASDNEPWRSGSEPDRFNGARGIAFNSDGTRMYVSDTYNNRVQVFAVANNGSNQAPDLLHSIYATETGGFNNPWHLTYYNGSIYVADLWATLENGDHGRIQKCDALSYTCSTFILSGPAIEGDFGISLNLPTSIAFGTVGSTDYAYITDGMNQRVVRCNAGGGGCEHFAGTPGEPGSDTGHFFWPEDIAVSGGKVYVADKFNHVVQIFNANTINNVDNVGVRGTLQTPYPVDSGGSRLYSPYGVAVAPNGSLYVAEQMGMTLVKYTSPGGAFEWRKGAPGLSGLGQWIWWSGEPEYTGADVDHFSSIGIDGGLGVDSHNRVYVPDIADHRVVIYLPDGTVFDTLGNGQGDDNYHFSCPTAVAIRPDNGDIYVADSCNARVQVYDSQRVYKGTLGVTQVEGTDSQHFAWPHGLAVDASGNAYVADQNNLRVQKCRLLGSSYTCVPFAGVPGVGGTDFRFSNGPVGIAIGPDGLIYVVEQWQNRVQVFDPSGAYRTTLGGNWGGGTGNLRNPGGVAVDSSNNVYVTDTNNNRLVKYTRGVPGWTQLNVNGWGEQQNGRSTPIRKVTINSQDYLYVGTENSNGQPGSPSVRRMDSAGKWQVVSAPGFDDLSNSSIVDMFVYGVTPNEYLYANTFNWNGAQIWRCPLSGGCDEGSDWQRTMVTGQGVHDSIFTPFQTFGADLYVSSASYYQDGGVDKTEGAKVWKLVGDTWVHAGLTLDTHQAGEVAVLTSIQSLAEFSGHLLAGSADWVNNNPGQLWSYDGINWDPLTLNGFGDPHNNSISSMVVFKSNLYVGVGNNDTGAKLYRYNASFGLSSIMTDGFGDPNNTSIQSLAADDNNIYAVTHNSVTGLQIWRSGNEGASWSEFLLIDGFGSSLNAGPDLSSSLLLANNRVYLGTWNDTNGGGVWASDPITSFTISGTITPTSPTLMPDSIVVTLQPGGLTTSVSGGGFSFASLGVGSYTVTPARPGCTFTPTNRQVTITGSTSIPAFSVKCATTILLSPADGTQLDSLLPVDLSWSPVSGATKYTLILSTSPTFANTLKSVSQAGTSYAFSGLANGATYFWRVKVAAPSAGDWSVGWKFTAPIPPAAPTLLTPKNLAVISAVPSTNLHPLFTWKAATVPTNGKPVEHYHLQIARKNTFDNLDLDEYTRDVSPTYTPLFDLLPNQVYYWRVRAFNTSGGYSKWSSVFSFKFLPGAVGLDWIENQDTLLRPTLHWHDDWNVGKYNIQICQRISAAKCSSFISAVVTGLSYTLTKSLLPHTLYNWHVQAVGTAGVGPWTDYAADAAAWTSPAPPAAPLPVWPADKGIVPDKTHSDFPPTLDWSDVPGASSYLVQISTDAGFFNGSTPPITVDDDPLTSELLADELLHNQVYYWRVSACNFNNECSLYTTTRKLTTKPDVPVSDTVGPVDDETTAYSTGVYRFIWTDDNPNPASKYNVQICSTYNCSSIYNKATVTNSREYQWLLPSHKNMWWRVQGVGITTGDWMDPELVETVTTPAAPVLAFPIANAVMTSTKDIQYSWKEVTGADHYNLQVSYNNSTFDAPDLLDLPELTALDFTDHNLAYGTVYWRVRARTAGYWGQWSAARKLLIKPVVAGFVRDLDENAIPDADVTISGGFSAAADGSGLYVFSNPLPTGAKTLTVSADSYLPATRSLSLANGGNYLPTNFNLAQVNSTDNIYRFVLSWDNPLDYRDLDLHAWLPAATPGHIYWQNTGRLGASPFAQLTTNDITPQVEVMDIGPLQPGKYMIGVNQFNPDSGPWSGANVKVEVFLGSDLKKSCTSPNGKGLWWYVMDVTLSPGPGSSPLFTCKSSIRTTPPPLSYSEKTITGTFTQPNGHPVQDVTLDYGVGAPVIVGSPFSLSGLGNGPYHLSPSKDDWTFIQDPPNPVDPGTEVHFTAIPPADIVVGGEPNAVAVQGDYLYVGGGGKLYIVNVKDKLATHEMKPIWIAEDTILDVVVQGNFAYVAQGLSGLSILDISDPTDPAGPSIIGSFNEIVDSVFVSGYYAYLGNGSNFIILDIHDPSKPKVVLKEEWETSAANRVLVKGNYAYVAGDDGLWIYNVTNPSKASYVSHWAGDDPENPVESFVGIAWNNNHLILTGLTDLYDLNIDDPAHPYQDRITETPFAEDAFQSTAAGNTLYVSDGSSGLLIYDISDSANDLPQVGEPLPPVDGFYSGIAAQDIYVYVIDGAMVQFVNAARRGSPNPAGSYTPTP